MCGFRMGLNQFSLSTSNIFERVVAKIARELRYIFTTKFDSKCGYFFYTLYGKRVYIKYREDQVDKREHLWKCQNIYFPGYIPKDGDTIVDFGAGYAEEAVYLSQFSANLKYVGVEILPSIYECASNTIGHLKGDYRISPFAVSSEKSLRLDSLFKYAGASDREGSGNIEVFCINWLDFKELYKLSKIDFLKMNIEGAEIDTLKEICDLAIIQRFAIECHDFRADKGHGEHFRTKKNIIELFESKGYQVEETFFGVSGYEWADNWVHAKLG